MATMLHAIEIPPEGADTLFASLTSAYDALPPAMRARVDPMKAIHSYAYMRSIRYPNAAPMRPEQLERVRDMVHPLIRTHPETGRRALYVSEYIIREFEGMGLEDSQALLAQLNAFATEDRFVYRHRWRVGDLLVWDNRATMHKATPYDDVRYRRRMHRSMVQGDVPF
jgi:taurine dioxygenase